MLGRYHYAADALAGWAVALIVVGDDMKQFTLAAVLCLVAPLAAQQPPRPTPAPAPAQDDSLRPAPNRRADEGKGPYKTLVVRGAMLIDGTGGPPRGPVDIVVEGNRITAVRSAGTPGLAAAREPRPAGGV